MASDRTRAAGSRASAAADRFPPFEPHPLLGGFHRMTLAAALLRPAHRQRREGDEVLHVPVDGETTLLARCAWQPQGRPAPVLLLLHGLGGDDRSAYMLGTARKAWTRGLHVVRLNLRGAGGTGALAASTYHGGLTADVHAVVTRLLGAGEVNGLVLAGFSLGGNLALRLAGEWGGQAPEGVLGVAAVSPGIDLAACVDRVDHDPGLRLYRWVFLRNLLKDARAWAAARPGRRLHPGLHRARTLRAFDTRHTAPLHGFADAAEYYACASALPLLGRIAVPALALHAGDDRIVPVAPLTGVEAASATALAVRLTARGGHCAFVGRRPAGTGADQDADRFWAEGRVVEWAFRLAEAARTVDPASAAAASD